MVYARRHRLTTFVLLAAYLLANVAGGLLHDHAGGLHAGSTAGHHGPGEHSDPSEHDGAESPCAGHDHAADDHAEQHGSHAAAQARGEHGSYHDDDCAVCRFVGQRVMPVASAQLGDRSQWSVELALVHPVTTAAPIARTTHSRAPPLLG